METTLHTTAPRLHYVRQIAFGVRREGMVIGIQNRIRIVIKCGGN